MDIVEELRNDRERGARRLESEYRAGLMTLARRFCADEGDAEELVNRTFAAVVEGIDDYIEQSAFFAWMCRILSNIHAKDARRKMGSAVVADPAAVDAAADPASDQRIFQEVDAGLLRDAVQDLPPDIRNTLLLHYFMDIPVREVARVLSVPSGTVKWRLHYARMILAAKLGTRRPGVRLILLALLFAAGLAVGRGVYTLGTAMLETRSKSAEFESHAESAESVSHAEFAESVSHAEFAESVSHAEIAESAESVPVVPVVPAVPFNPSTLSTSSTSSTPETPDMNAKPLLAAASLALAAAPATATWTEIKTEGGNRYVTDGNYCFHWQISNDRRLILDSYDPSVSSVCDMSTLDEDLGSTGTLPTVLQYSCFNNKAGITEIILPECITRSYYQAFQNVPDLEKVVLSSGFQFCTGGNMQGVFWSSAKLKTVYHRGMEEKEGWVQISEATTSFQNNMFYGCKSIRHFVAPGLKNLPLNTFRDCNALETVEVNGDLTEIGGLCFNNCKKLTRFTAGDNTFKSLANWGTGSGQVVFCNCSILEQPLDFSRASFTTLYKQDFYGSPYLSEIRLPPTLTTVGEQALRDDSRKVQRRIYFYGPPPSFSGNLALGGTGADSLTRFIVFVRPEHEADWTNQLATVSFEPVNETDRARSDFPTKSEAVKVRGKDVLGKSYYAANYNNVKRYYYVCRFSDEIRPTFLLIY